MLVNAQHDGRGERLEYGDCVNYFNGANDNETDENGNVLDEVEEFIHMMEAEMHHSQHIDPTAHFLQDHINFWTHADGHSRLMGMTVQQRRTPTTSMSSDQPSFIRILTFFTQQLALHNNCLLNANKIAILFHYVNHTTISTDTILPVVSLFSLKSNNSMM